MYTVRISSQTERRMVNRVYYIYKK